MFFGRRLVGVPLDDRDQVLDAGLLEVLAGDGDSAGVDVVSVEMAAGLAQGDREPEPRLAGGRAELDDPLGTHRLGELAKQAAIGGRDIGVARALAGLVKGGQDLLFAVILGQRGLRHVAFCLRRPRAAAGTAPAARATRQLIGAQLAILIRVALAELRGRSVDLGRREVAVTVGVERLEQRVLRAPPRSVRAAVPSREGPRRWPRSSCQSRVLCAS